MADTLAEWLARREAADWAARSDPLTRWIAAGLPHDRPTRVLDLATGTGSNLRFLAGRFPSSQDWLVVDESASLLALVVEKMGPWAAARGCTIQTSDRGCRIRGRDLVCDVETRRRNLRALDDEALFARRDLVTASALLDLVSEDWLHTLAMRCRAAHASVLFAISYDGSSACTPVEPEDDLVRQIFNQHQRTDKGLGGRAAGPDGHALASRCFAEAGYEVRNESSNWNLGPDHRALQETLIAGWAEAATAIAPDRAAMLADWLERRLAHVAAGRSSVTVGHRDLAARLPAPMHPGLR